MKYPYIRLNDYIYDYKTLVLFEDGDIHYGRFIDKYGNLLSRYSIISRHPEAQFKTPREAIGIMKKFFDVEQLSNPHNYYVRNKYYYVKNRKNIES